MSHGPHIRLTELVSKRFEVQAAWLLADPRVPDSVRNDIIRVNVERRKNSALILEGDEDKEEVKKTNSFDIEEETEEKGGGSISFLPRTLSVMSNSLSASPPRWPKKL